VTRRSSPLRVAIDRALSLIADPPRSKKATSSHLTIPPNPSELWLIGLGRHSVRVRDSITFAVGTIRSHAFAWPSVIGVVRGQRRFLLLASAVRSCREGRRDREDRALDNRCTSARRHDRLRAYPRRSFLVRNGPVRDIAELPSPFAGTRSFRMRHSSSATGQ